VTDHARQLLEKHFRKPFLNLQYAAGLERMDPATVREGIAWLDDCFHIIRHQDDIMPSVEWILDLARAAVLRSGFNLNLT
jgi:twinkle protein